MAGIDLTRPGRPPRPGGGVLSRLTEESVQLQTPAPAFAALAADTLGNAGTDTDGFDSVMLEIATALDGEGAALTALDDELAAAAFVEGEFESGTLSPVALEIAAALSDGDPIIGALDGLLGP